MELLKQKSNIVSNISLNELYKNTKSLCEMDKTSGTVGEFQAIEYLKNKLSSYNISHKEYDYKGYLSYPISAKVQLNGITIKAKTRSFSISTDKNGISGELFLLPCKINTLPQPQYEEYLASVNIKDKIVVNKSGGLGNQRNMYYAGLHGASGYINICLTEKDVIHEGISSPIWGTPTPDNVAMLPSIPMLAITHEDGKKLLSQLKESATNVTIFTETKTGWQKQRILEATIEGETDQYVLIGAHLDTWYYGATDNTTGSAICLEIARILNEHKVKLKRGIKIAWWPGHSTGRYGGSTWYCDNNWHDLYDNCVAYINIDMLGSTGATDYSKITVTADIFELAKEAIKEVTTQVTSRKRPTRSADQSFWGPGLPYTYILSNREKHLDNCGPNSGTPWWWHNEHDTFDKVDKDVLLTDAKIHGLIIASLCCDDILPLSIMSTISEIKSIVESLKLQSDDLFDFAPVQQELSKLMKTTLTLMSKQKFLKNEELYNHNKKIVKAIKYLTQINYSNVSPYEHALGLSKEPLGLLHDAVLLPSLEGKNEFGFVLTKLVRNRNFVVQNLRKALETLS